jgi:hypothetical protein
MKTKSFTKIMCILLIILMTGFVADVWAALTGKIAGQVTGNDTGEPLAGANVVLEGTGMGAAADESGYFVILNVPPGTYKLTVVMVGYALMVQENVVVNINQTTTLDLELRSETLTSEAVVVTAERPVVQLDVSSSQKIISVENLMDRPVDNLSEVLNLEANVEVVAGAEGQGLVVRGGQLNETDITIDGLSTRNERNQIANTTIGLTGIQEIELITGGFNAEYGDIRSGMVNIVSKEGSLDKYSVSFDGRIAPAQRKHFGPSPYSIEGPQWRVYGGPDAMTGITQEMVDSGQYPFTFVGWDAVAASNLADSDPNNDYTPQQLIEIWKWQHRTIEYANRPDYIGDITLSGPIPFTPVTFLLSTRYEDLLLAYPMSRTNSIASTTLFNLSYRLSPTMKLAWNNNLIISEGVSSGFFDFSTGYIDGSEVGTLYARDNVTSGAGGGGIHMWYEGAFNPIETNQYRSSLSLNHVLNPTTFYDLRVEYTRFKTTQEPIDVRSTDAVFRTGDVVLDESPRGFSGIITEQYDISGRDFTSGGGRGQDHSRYWGIGLFADLVSQIHRSHELKAGFSFEYTDFSERREENHGAVSQPFEEYPWNWWYYDAQPIRLSAYIQDKMEFEGLVANLGLRLEYQDTQLNQFILDPDAIFATNPYTIDNYIEGGYSWEKLTNSNKGTQLYIQPRVGISHPITAESKVFFNYGHFLQPPVIDQLYLQRTNTSTGGVVPNLNADWPRTIAYELGFEVGFAESYLVRFTGFYKDVSDELSDQNIISFNEANNVATTANTRYRDIRGFEIRLEKRYGRWFYGWIQAEYLVTSLGLTGYRSIYEDPQLTELQANDARQINFPGTPSLNALITLQTPREWGPTLLDHHFLGGWRLNWWQTWADGGQELLNQDAPLNQQIWVDVINSHNTDILLEKIIDFTDVRFALYMQVKNLFNWKGFPNPRNYNQYVSSLKFPHEQGSEKGNDKLGEWDKDYIELGWNDWAHFVNPRRVWFGLRVNL